MSQENFDLTEVKNSLKYWEIRLKKESRFFTEKLSKEDLAEMKNLLRLVKQKIQNVNTSQKTDPVTECNVMLQKVFHLCKRVGIMD